MDPEIFDVMQKCKMKFEWKLCWRGDDGKFILVAAPGMSVLCTQVIDACDSYDLLYHDTRIMSLSKKNHIIDMVE